MGLTGVAVPSVKDKYEKTCLNSFKATLQGRRSMDVQFFKGNGQLQ